MRQAFTLIHIAVAMAACPLAAHAQQTGGLPAVVGGGVSRVGSGVETKGPLPGAVMSSSSSVPLPPGAPALRPDTVKEVMDQVSPLNTSEILDLRRQLIDRQQAFQANVTGKPPAKPTTSIYNLDLAPGSTPPVVRIEVGQGSIISFLDMAGQPWPAKVADNFAPSIITLSQFTEHQLSIGTMSQAPVNAGVAVALQNIPVAITFNVISGQPMIDAQVHMVVPRYLNGAPPGVGALRGEPSLNAADLMSFLLRTPPQSAKPLIVQGLPGAMAWQISPQRMVLRTTALVTTGSFRVQGIGDGTFVYEIPLSPMVMVASGSTLKKVQIQGINSNAVKTTHSP